MATRSFHTELLARNLALADQIAPATVLDWDEGAWRGPRLLVPVIVEALPVAPAQAAGATWADVAIDPMDPLAARPGPFDTTTGTRPAGVHLHWALPDGLTRGEAPDTPDDPPLAADAAARAEQPEAPDTRRLRYPAVPDRWLVVRVQAGATASSPRRLAAWVIAGALDPRRRRAVPLAEWREDRPPASEVPPVDATGPGEPTFAAYADNVRNLLAFHDPLADVARGPLTYLVCGWYGRLDDDPLYAPRSESAWLGVVERLGWSVDADALKSLRAGDEGRLTQALLDSADETPAVNALQVPGLAGVAAAGAAGAAGAGAAPAAVRLALGTGVAKFVTDADRRGARLQAVHVRENRFLTHGPRQMLCHGAVFDVAWGGRGGGFDLPEAGPPPAGSVTVAVGNTASQALAALAAREAGDASLARLVDAFAVGALGELSQPGGVAQLEALLHAEDFASRPGGFVLDRIEQGDLFPPASGAESPAPPRSGGAVPGVVDPGRGDGALAGTLQVQRRFFRADATLGELQAGLQATLDGRVLGGAAGGRPGDAPRGRPRTVETVRRSMPRWYEPRDPVLLLRQARRTYKHGEDDAIDGTLGCRLTPQIVRQLSVNPWAELGGGIRNGPLVDVVGADLTTDDLRSGQIPAECGALVHETLLLDPTVVTVARELVVQRASRLRSGAGAGARAVTPAVAGRRVQVEQTMLLAAALDPQIDLQALAAVSSLEGAMPHPRALQFWHRPWSPVELAWEVAWHPSPGAERDWVLGTTDFALRGDVPTGTDGEPALLVRGRSLLTPAVARTLERRLRRFLEDEASGERDEATPDEEADLARVMADFARLDVLGASLGGLHDTLMARAPVPGRLGLPDPDAWRPLAGATALWLLRAGHLRLTRLRIVDAFGQFHDLPPAALDAPIRADDLASPRAGPAFLELPPRVMEPTRLMFRLLHAGHDADEATRDRSPVCGWIVPDHLDEALEVFDAQGVAQGQLQPADDGRTLEWQGVPGRAGALGAPPALAQPQLAGFVGGLLQHGLRDAARLAGDAPPSETALSALLRMIDATLWTTDPVGRAGNEHLSLLVGHPLALVRAELRLEVQADAMAAPLQGPLYAAARAELERTPLPVRLGELLALDDGLMGYFVNDDYARFYPVHESLAPRARPAGPGQGHLGSAALPPDTAPHAVEHPYIDRTPLVMIRPGQVVRLTLVVDPRGAVHATCGFLPRKKIELMREHVAPALAAMDFTFRVGPVLVDPDAVRMPVPAEIAGGWSWVRRVNVTTWQEDPVFKASQDALLPDAPAQLSEGWLKLSGTLKPGDPGRS